MKNFKMMHNSSSISANAIPRLNLLTEEQLNDVHNWSVNILSTTGVRIDSGLAREIFKKAGCKQLKNNRFLIPDNLISWAIKSAPSDITVYNRQGDPAFRLGTKNPDKTFFGVGVTNTHFQNIKKDDVIPYKREHNRTSISLGNTLKGFDMISTPGIPADLPPETLDLYNTLDLYTNTIKPIVILILKERRINDVFDLLEHLHGDLSEKPFLILYVNPITPLVLNENTVDKMVTGIRRGIPVIYSNYGMYGATTPITPAGSLTLLNAELLVGLVLSQLIREGAPVILGSLPAAFDMKTMGSVYTHSSFLLNLACAEMMAFYNIPHCGTSGSGLGWGPDLSASGSLWINHLTSCLGKVGMVPFVGGNFDSRVFSPVTVVYSDLIIKQVKAFSKGFRLDEFSVALDEIMKVGAGGDFLTSELTLKLYKELHNERSIWSGMTLEDWIRKGNPNANEILREYARDLIENLEEPEDYNDLIGKGESFIHRV